MSRLTADAIGVDETPGGGTGTVNGWQPIETAPKTFDCILVCDMSWNIGPDIALTQPEDYPMTLRVVWWDDDSGWVTGMGNDWWNDGQLIKYEGRPTHWMHLPEPPEVE